LKRLIFAILVLALVLETMPAFGHRMFIGQRVTVDLYAIFDDGEPAKDASVQVFRDGELYAENKTDSTGKFSLVLPGKGTGEWKFIVSGGGHVETANVYIANDNSKTAAVALALVAVPVAIIWRRFRRQQ